MNVEKPVLPVEGNDLISPEYDLISDLQVILSGATMPLGTKKYLDELLNVGFCFSYGVEFVAVVSMHFFVV